MLVLSATTLVAAALALAVVSRESSGEDAASSHATSTYPATTALPPSSLASTPPTPAPSAAPLAPTTAPSASGPPPVIRVAEPIDPANWPAIVDRLPPVALPSDCGLPLDEPASLPNSDRGYRGGVHQGIDFICMERGRDAVAALPGTVVVANETYVDPTPAERSALLAEAQALGYTPPWTLAMLYGRFVVIDHGVMADVGHVVSVYAHLEDIDDTIRPGLAVAAGTRLGEIGNRGTEPAATGADDPRSLHLHWELLVNDVFVGAGLDTAATRSVYADLFGEG